LIDSVYNHHIVTVVLEEVGMKTGALPVPKCSVLYFNT